MKKTLVINVLTVALLVLPAVTMADVYYEMDASTAASMRLIGVSSDDSGDLKYVGYYPGGSADQVYYGGLNEYGAGEGNMIYDVGFTGGFGEGQDEDLTADITIGIIRPSLSGVFDGFLLPVANDDDDTFMYRAYVTTGEGTVWSDWTSAIEEGNTANLLVETEGLDYLNVTGIGFQIRWDRTLNDGHASDDYNTSVVPVPGAILLGLLGMSAAGVKLRRFA